MPSCNVTFLTEAREHYPSLRALHDAIMTANTGLIQ